MIDGSHFWLMISRPGSKPLVEANWPQAMEASDILFALRKLALGNATAKGLSVLAEVMCASAANAISQPITEQCAAPSPLPLSLAACKG